MPKLVNTAKDNNIPGVAVAEIDTTGQIKTSSAGVTNNSAPKAVTDQTVFEAASLSKPVFAYIVLKMVERGELDLDMPLTKILENKFGEGHPSAQFGPPEPGIRDHENYKKLTARMLLSHQAGLPNEFGSPTGPPEFKFISNAAEGFDYSGEAYRFLNEVIEKITDPKSLEEIAQEEFKKIGLEHTSFVRPENTEDLAVGHHENGDADLRRHFYGVHPAGSLHTTAEDYGKFLKACVADEFVRKEMFKPIVQTLSGKDTKGIKQEVPREVLDQISWGLGIGLQNNSDGSMTAFHWGDGSGTCRNFAAINLSTNQAVACLTNSANGPAAFKQLCEPVVGDLTAVSQWLSQRENLPMKQRPSSQAQIPVESKKSIESASGRTFTPSLESQRARSLSQEEPSTIAKGLDEHSAITSNKEKPKRK